MSYISNGNVMVGPAEVSQALNKLVGEKGKYQMTLGALTVANINGLALAVGPVVMKEKAAGGTDVPGAVSILLENQGKKKWVITHMHHSTQSPAAAGAATGQ